MVGPKYVIIASVELDCLLSSRVILEEDPIAIARSLRLLVFVFIVFHVPFVSRFEVYRRLNIAWVLLRKV